MIQAQRYLHTFSSPHMDEPEASHMMANYFSKNQQKFSFFSSLLEYVAGQVEDTRLVAEARGGH